MTLEDVKVDTFMVTNRDGDPKDFAAVIQAWEDVYAGQMARDRGLFPIITCTQRDPELEVQAARAARQAQHAVAAPPAEPTKEG